jgi:transposase
VGQKVDIMENRTYSENFKQRAVQKLLLPGSLGLSGTAKDIGVATSTLFGWKKQYANAPTMKKSKTGLWSPDQKLQAINETFSMSEGALGEYLRRNGLLSSDLQEWRENFLKSQEQVGRPKKDPEIFELRKKEKSLKKDLRRKEKALAEMSARVILLKKSHEIWGEPEDDA